jgi:hypothetical protein
LTQYAQEIVPEEVVKEINFQNSRRESNQVIQLITVDRPGFPFVTLLSFHEVVVSTDRRFLFLSIHKGGRTSENIAVNKKVTIVFVLQGSCFYIQGMAEILSDLDVKVEGFEQSLVRVTVQHVFHDVNKQAPITSGITYAPAKVIDEHLKIVEKIKEFSVKLAEKEMGSSIR